MPPRLTPPDPDAFDAEQLTQLAKTRPLREGGRPINLWATLARRPELLRRVNALGGYFPTRSSLSLRDRELAILRVAGTIDAAYVEAQHRVIAAEALTAAEREAAVNGGADHAWTDADAALLAFATELTATRTLTDATWDALPLDDDAKLELVVLVGFYGLIGGLTSAVAIDVDA
jgi:4-carboxymuconolactone decarboxylase